MNENSKLYEDLDRILVTREEIAKLRLVLVEDIEKQ